VFDRPIVERRRGGGRRYKWSSENVQRDVMGGNDDSIPKKENAKKEGNRRQKAEVKMRKEC